MQPGFFGLREREGAPHIDMSSSGPTWPLQGHGRSPRSWALSRPSDNSRRALHAPDPEWLQRALLSRGGQPGSREVPVRRWDLQVVGTP